MSYTVRGKNQKNMGKSPAVSYVTPLIKRHLFSITCVQAETSGTVSPMCQIFRKMRFQQPQRAVR